MFSPTVYLQNKLSKYSSNKIINGFFNGLNYKTQESLSFPIIAGTYEKELFPILEKIIAYDIVIDVGAGDGYYVVGLLNHYRHIKVFAYEQLEYRRLQLLKNIEINSILPERYKLFGSADIENLSSLLNETSKDSKIFMIMDIEGYEETLLNPELLPQLKNCTILVEVHEHLVPGLSKKLKSRFYQTHRLIEISSIPRTVKDIDKPYHIIDKLIFKKQLNRLLGEGRDVRMDWYYFEPLS